VGTRYLKEGEAVLTGYSLKGVGAGQKDNMDPLHQQRPNRRFLLSNGPAHLVTVYEIGKKNFLFHYDTARIKRNRREIIQKFDNKIEKSKREIKKSRLLDKKIRKVGKKDRTLREGNQIMRWGEPLAVYDSTLTIETVRQMSNFLKSRGFYANKINVEENFNGKKNKVNLTYRFKLGPEYMIDSMEYVIPDYAVKELFMSHLNERVVTPKMKIRQPDLSAERDRVYEFLVNRGYYAFTKEYVRFEIDSVSLGDPTKLIVRQIITNPPKSYQHKLYVVDSIVFVTDAGASTTKNIPNEEFKGITYNYGRFKYAPKILDWHTQLEANKIYERNKVLETQRQLAILDNFKFVNINFDTLNGQFVAHIFTSPADRFQSTTEAGFSVQSQGYPGPFAQINLKNRNLFRGLEITELNSQFKLQGVPGVTETTSNYSSIQYGSELSITFPQFLSPLGKFYKKKISRFNPRTRFGLAFNHEDRLDEYKRTTFSTSMSYTWKTREKLTYTFKPAEISFINSNTIPGFIEELETFSPSYANTFKSSFVSGGSFQFVFNDDYGVGTSSFLQLTIETGGHLSSLINRELFGPNISYFQYSKFGADLRRIIALNRRQILAGRFNIGVAVPYRDNGVDANGNQVASSLPYEKYYFAGGSNSIRAWRPRRLGPGSFGEVNDKGIVNYVREQPGDMILETSIEFRQKLTGFIDWALFVDAGNIWSIRSETVDPTSDPEQDDGRFSFDTFTQEIAIGAGFGLRFDLSFLVFRLDIAYKVYDPAQPPGQRWVAGDNDIITFGSKFPFVYLDPFNSRTATFNIGIGYPF
jgi:outer membrane protein assembly factor BamA